MAAMPVDELNQALKSDMETRSSNIEVQWPGKT